MSLHKADMHLLPALPLNALLVLLIVALNALSSLASKDYYELLGVKRNARDKDIAKAFRRLALKYHPDRNKGDKNAEKKFVEIAKGSIL